MELFLYQPALMAIRDFPYSFTVVLLDSSCYTFANLVLLKCGSNKKSQMMLNVVLAEDNEVVRNGIRALLETDQEIRVVADAANGRDLLSKLRREDQIDLVLTDFNMPEMGGLELIRQLKMINPDIKILILSIHDHEQYVIASFLEGASGYLLKNDHAEELLFSVKHIKVGGKYLSSELSIRMLNQKCMEKTRID